MALTHVMSIVIFALVSSQKCKVISDRDDPEYYMTATCQRSTLKTLKMAEVDSLDGCKSLAADLRGFAFSFSGKLRSCIVHSCPEVENSTALVYDDGYDYYTIFANPIPPSNSSCVEGVGVFVYHLLEANYSSAKNSCADFGGILPDVATEKRNERLSDPIQGQFYVGMDDLMMKGDFIRSNGEPLRCTSYRAWAPGHPRSSEGERCVTLDSAKMWRTVDCGRKLRFICEIYPGEVDEYDGVEVDGCMGK